LNPLKLEELLERVKKGRLSIPDAMNELRALPFKDIGFAKLDTHRSIRKGFPEVVYCERKSPAQVAKIAKEMLASGLGFIGSRASVEVFKAVKKAAPGAVYHETARMVVLHASPLVRVGLVAVVSAGTSDEPVAEEAAVTAEALGSNVERIYDAGVAGIHRLLASAEILQRANAVVAVAGMEGALPSAAGGLTDAPVIAVPTSVGYGLSLGGLTALLGMMNSCSSNVSVVNIDNGFGAGYVAATINRKVMMAADRAAAGRRAARANR
jgi:hypothetical protein